MSERHRDEMVCYVCTRAIPYGQRITIDGETGFEGGHRVTLCFGCLDAATSAKRYILRREEEKV